MPVVVLQPFEGQVPHAGNQIVSVEDGILKEMVTMITEQLVSTPKSDRAVRKTVELFQHAGWAVVGVEDMDNNNIKYTIRWSEEKSAPVYPPNPHLKHK